MESLFFEDPTDFKAHRNGIDHNKVFKKMWIIIFQ